MIGIYGISKPRVRLLSLAMTTAITRAARQKIIGWCIIAKCPFSVPEKFHLRIYRMLTQRHLHLSAEMLVPEAASTLASVPKRLPPPLNIPITISPSFPISCMVLIRISRIRHPVRRHLRHRPPIPQVAQRCRRANPRVTWCITAAGWWQRKFGGPGARAHRGCRINRPCGHLR